jgi:hypothetical protein
MNQDWLRALIRFTLAAGMGLLAVSASMHRALAETKGSEQREAVVPKDDPKARERVIALAQFGYWLSGNKDGRMETAVTDLNGDGTAEIFIRLVDATTCDADRKVCKTMAMKHDGKEWKVIFDRPTSSIELGKAGKDGMRSILVNGYEARSWNGRFYQIDVGAMKTVQVKLQSETNGSRAIELARGFGNAAEKLVATKKAVISTGSIDLGIGKAVVARLEGDAACGSYIGCPFRVLVKDTGGRDVPVLESAARSVDGKADIKTLAVMRGGWNTIMVTPPNGTPLLAEWDGQKYSMETRR